MKKPAASILTALCLGTLGVPAAEATRSPEDTIRETAGRVTEVLADDSLSTQQKHDRLVSYLDTCCDFETTSKLVLARNWRSLSEDQRKEFVVLFRYYLIETYGDNVDAYEGETVEVLGGRDEARGDYTVMTKIRRGSAAADILVDYRLRKNAQGEWKILDVIAEGISLVSNLRSQFQEVISRDGPDGLLAALREKSGNPPPAPTLQSAGASAND